MAHARAVLIAAVTGNPPEEPVETRIRDHLYAVDVESARAVQTSSQMPDEEFLRIAKDAVLALMESGTRFEEAVRLKHACKLDADAFIDDRSRGILRKHLDTAANRPFPFKEFPITRPRDQQEYTVREPPAFDALTMLQPDRIDQLRDVYARIHACAESGQSVRSLDALRWRRALSEWLVKALAARDDQGGVDADDAARLIGSIVERIDAELVDIGPPETIYYAFPVGAHLSAGLQAVPGELQMDICTEREEGGSLSERIDEWRRDCLSYFATVLPSAEPCHALERNVRLLCETAGVPSFYDRLREQRPAHATQGSTINAHDAAVAALHETEDLRQYAETGDETLFREAVARLEDEYRTQLRCAEEQEDRGKPAYILRNSAEEQYFNGLRRWHLIKQQMDAPVHWQEE